MGDAWEAERRYNFRILGSSGCRGGEYIYARGTGLRRLKCLQSGRLYCASTLSSQRSAVETVGRKDRRRKERVVIDEAPGVLLYILSSKLSPMKNKNRHENPLFRLKMYRSY